MTEAFPNPQNGPAAESILPCGVGFSEGPVIGQPAAVASAAESILRCGVGFSEGPAIGQPAAVASAAESILRCGVGFSPQRWLQPPNSGFLQNEPVVAWAFPKDPQSGSPQRWLQPPNQFFVVAWAFSPQPWLSPRPATG